MFFLFRVPLDFDLSTAAANANLIVPIDVKYRCIHATSWMVYLKKSTVR